MKNKKVYGLIGVAALAAVGGTFAYYNAKTVYDNNFDTTNYGTSTYEKFNPADGHEWMPGAKVDKAVYATNTGDGDVWVRVKFTEKWQRGQNEVHSEITSASEKFQPVSDKVGHQLSPFDGAVDEDPGSVVYKDLKLDNWTLADDGFYYYNTTLKTGETTDTLLRSVTLCEDTDMGKFKWESSYIIVDKLGENDLVPIYPEAYKGNQWTPIEVTDEEPVKLSVSKPKKEDYKKTDGSFDEEKYNEAIATYNETYKGKDIFTYVEKKLDDTLQGYANAGYSLDIEVQFIQADEDGQIAKDATWDSTIVTTLANDKKNQ